MAKILLLNPNRWGRGITPIWIASHIAVLKSKNHDVKLFDCTFYEKWRYNEVAYNTANQQYKPSDYDKQIRLNHGDVRNDFQALLNSFDPDILFWSALSSHIHGEGEYVNIQYGHQLVEQLTTSPHLKKITGGLQPTANPASMPERFPNIDFFIQGESDLVLADLADRLSDPTAFFSTPGLVYRKNGVAVVNPPQKILNMNDIPPYDYTLFDDQVFLRPYNGAVIRALDYEMSRGCLYTCSYCVETVIQRYYGFNERTHKGGVLKNAKGYLRHKTAQTIFKEILHLRTELGIRLFRCQDTNFLTIDRATLNEVAALFESSRIDVQLYIETRPDGINPENVALLKRLHVDGVGMGIELAVEEFREENLFRYCPKEKIEEAFRLLREAGIRRTAYNIIGLPEETEDMILETIRFNQKLNPDNVTVAFYSPYMGTEQQQKGARMQEFEDYEYNVDAQLRTLSKSTYIGKELLEFYKRYFVELVRDGLQVLPELKRREGLAV